jgi:hypothetical protein
MMIKVEVQFENACNISSINIIFSSIQKKVHQNSQTIDLTWHDVMAKWNSQLFFNWVIYIFLNILMVNIR